MRLQEIMTTKHLSHNQLAKLSGVSQPFISAIVAGKKQPTLPTLQKLAKGLGVTLAELLNDELTATDGADKDTAKSA